LRPDRRRHPDLLVEIEAGAIVTQERLRNLK